MLLENWGFASVVNHAESGLSFLEFAGNSFPFLSELFLQFYPLEL